ncbi:MAG: hypothetical protein JWM11_6221 [Planctomycetaceae bacterium]|nr:hypothetical protein [Planctomycetaceae bacterium]
MKLAYLDCSSGISGDMTLAALIDAGVDASAIQYGIASLGLDGIHLKVSQTIRCGFRATYVKVEHPPQHTHRNLHDIFAIIDRGSELSEKQKARAKDLFTTIGRAEARVHGLGLDQIQFHEVGAIDSIVDIVGAAIGWDLLGADSIMSSPIPPGRGYVHIAHGVCPIPAPGTAELLKGLPLADVPINAELTTPTGAAIVQCLADRFGPLPAMTIRQIGYGAGTKDFPDRANILRLFVGDLAESPDVDEVLLLETNLDDVSGEILGYTKQKLLSAGALDVFATAIQMKKDRPGTLLSVLCRPSDQSRLEQLIFDETGTFGIRQTRLLRSKRRRQAHNVETPWGTVAGKLGWFSGGVPVFTPEFDSCAAVAQQHGVTLRDVYRAAESAWMLESVPKSPAIPVSAEAPRHDHDHDH